MSLHFLLRLPTAIAFLLVAAVAVSLALGGLALVRKKYSPEELRENHEVAAIIFGAFGWLYAVIVAFVVFVTWTGYDDANKNFQLEVSQALDVFYGADGFPPDAASKIRTAASVYLKSVDRDELQQMASGEITLYSMQSLRTLTDIFTNADESMLRNRDLYSASLRQLDGLRQYRRLRIFSANNTAPSLIWFLLVIGSLITICNTYFFGMKRAKVQYIMTAALTVMLSLVLLLIYVLDHPFTGTSRVSDAPLRQALAIMNSKNR